MASNSGTNPDDGPREGSSSGRCAESPRHHVERPNYMTVGSGSMSESAYRLTTMLDADSGYGGSVDGGSMASGWQPNDNSILLPGTGNEGERKAVASHILQLY
jgi:mitofusin 2